MGRAVALYIPLLADVVPHIGEPNQSLPSLMNEVRPTYLMGVPRTWEKIVANVQVAVDSAGVLARSSFALADAIGRRRMRAIWREGAASWAIEAAYWPMWLCVIWPALTSWGSPIPAEPAPAARRCRRSCTRPSVPGAFRSATCSG
jgi:hypothetical protein